MRDMHITQEQSHSLPLRGFQGPSLGVKAWQTF